MRYPQTTWQGSQFGISWPHLQGALFHNQLVL
jgi:hypothetical protein